MFKIGLYDQEYQDIFLENEIKANYISSAGTGMICLLLITFVLIGGTTLFIYKSLLKDIVIFFIFLSAALVVISLKFRCRGNWIKYLHSFYYILIICLFSLCAESGITAVCMALTLVIASMYYSEKYTALIASLTVLALICTLYFGNRFGLVDFINIGYASLPEGESVTVTGQIYSSFNVYELITPRYIHNIFLNIWLPAVVAYFITAVICMYVTRTGKIMIIKKAEDAERQARTDSELSIASSIQKSILTREFPSGKRYEISADMNAARNVGGDFYNFFETDENHIAIIIADVSDKGVPAALIMAKYNSLISSFAEMDMLPDEIFRRVNDTLCLKDAVNMFITAFMAIIDIRDGKVIYSNAGHNSPLIGNPESGYEYLETEHDIFLGGFENNTYTRYETTIRPGDRILLYTDGITEAMNPDGELYGYDRLREFMNRSAGSTQEVLELLKKDVDLFHNGAERNDDETVLLFELKDSY